MKPREALMVEITVALIVGAMAGIAGYFATKYLREPAENHVRGMLK